MKKWICLPNQAAEVAICAPASDWTGGRHRANEGPSTSLVISLLYVKLRSTECLKTLPSPVIKRANWPE